MCTHKISFSYHCHPHPRDLHSFPTRRSSDLPTAVLPEPMGPMRNTLGLPSMQVREDTENDAASPAYSRSEEHTSELQSPDHLVCRLLLEKKKKKRRTRRHSQCHRYLILRRTI